MSSRLIQEVFDLDLPAPEKHVATILAWHGDDDGLNIWPSSRTLARKTGYSVRNVRRMLKRLEKRGLIVLLNPHREGTRNLGGWRRPNEYRMFTSAVPKLSAEGIDVAHNTCGGGFLGDEDDKSTGVTSCHRSIHNAACNPMTPCPEAVTNRREGMASCPTAVTICHPTSSEQDRKETEKKVTCSFSSENEPRQSPEAKDLFAKIASIIATKKVSMEDFSCTNCGAALPVDRRGRPRRCEGCGHLPPHEQRLGPRPYIPTAAELAEELKQRRIPLPAIEGDR